jgi:hypothetical protein
LQSGDVAEQLKSFVFSNRTLDAELPQICVAILDIPQQRFCSRDNDAALSLITDIDSLHCFIDDFKSDKLVYVPFINAAMEPNI